MVKWRQMGKGGTIDDRRGQRSRGTGGRTAGFPIPLGGKVSLPVLLLAAVAFFFFNGGSGSPVDVSLDQLPGQVPQAPAGSNAVPTAPPGDDAGQFVAQISTDIEQMWSDVFAEAGRDYEPIGPRDIGPTVFTDGVDTACGQASSATGPFYCPRDEQVYIDLGFYDQLSERFGASGDFAQAYVLAHEVGHHVQHLLGIDAQVRRAVQDDPSQRNELSIRQELQADCFAGVWGHSVYERQLLEDGDLDEGLTAAAAIGDDRIQQRTSGRVDPESWTHGSSEQRSRWFRRGFDEGRTEACDTFSGDL